MSVETESPVQDPRAVTRPDEALLRYYVILSLCTLVFFPFVFVPLYFRYRTLRYRFDERGVSMSFGRFFHRETYVNYRRIQDIQLNRGWLQRRLGLGTLEIQTASGSSEAEMKIEGILEPERLRDFLYERMRGARDDVPAEPAAPGSGDGVGDGVDGGGSDPRGAEAGDAMQDEALVLLREIRDELRRMTPATETRE